MSHRGKDTMEFLCFARKSLQEVFEGALRVVLGGN